MATIFETLSSLGRDCEQLVSDIDLVRPATCEKNPSLAQTMELINGAASVYDLRFEALFDAYGAAVSDQAFFHYEIEECILQWWGACEDLRCAAEGAEHSLLSTDGLDNILLGIASMSKVRAARFFRLLADAAIEPAESSEPGPKDKV